MKQKVLKEKEVHRDPLKAINTFGCGTDGTMRVKYLIHEAIPLGLFPLYANVISFDSNALTIKNVTASLRPLMREPFLIRLWWRNHTHIRIVELPTPPYIGAFGYGRVPENFTRAEAWWRPTVEATMEEVKSFVFKCGYNLSVSIFTGSYGGSHRWGLEQVIKEMLADTAFMTHVSISITDIPRQGDLLAYDNFEKALPEIPSRNDVTLMLDDNYGTYDSLSAKVVNALIAAGISDNTQPTVPDLAHIFKRYETQVLGMSVIQSENPIRRDRPTLRRILDPRDGVAMLYSHIESVFSNNPAVRTSNFPPKDNGDEARVLLVITPHSKETFDLAVGLARDQLSSSRIIPLWAQTSDLVTTTALLYKVPIEELTQAKAAPKTMIPYV